jgi:glycolate oxidase FAD binding subunit
LAGAVPVAALREGGSAVAGALPDATVTPTSLEEVVEILKAASADGFGVVPVGAGTELGPTPPEGPFVALSTRGLTGVEVYEPADLTMSARAGMTLGEVADVTAQHSQWMPFDPPSAPVRTLGGLAATGTRAPLCASYGAPRDHILGLTLVTGDGRVLKLGGRVMKNVAGFDLAKLVVGSRGTLGVVVSVTVRLFPRPRQDIALVLDADGADGVGGLMAAARAVATAPVLPASAVLATGRRAPEGGAPTEGASLVVRLAGAPETVAADAARLQGHVGRTFRVVEGALAGTLFEALRDHAAADDVVVRLAALPASLDVVSEAVAALPGTVRTLADVMSGRVRVGADAMSTEALGGLQHAAGRLGGSCVLARGPVELARAWGASAAEIAEGRVGTLSSALRARFDPTGVLWPGRKP